VIRLIVDLDTQSDERGRLVAIEARQDVPFPIQRVYYIFGTDRKANRGFHAHRQLEQLMVCTSGACTVTLDDGSSRKNFRLENPTRGLLVGQMIWREMSDFTDDAVLMVLASRHYEAEDYIRDYEKFISARRTLKLAPTLAAHE